jgi:hypothetical protein
LKNLFICIIIFIFLLFYIFLLISSRIIGTVGLAVAVSPWKRELLDVDDGTSRHKNSLVAKARV